MAAADPTVLIRIQNGGISLTGWGTLVLFGLIVMWFGLRLILDMSNRKGQREGR